MARRNIDLSLCVVLSSDGTVDSAATLASVQAAILEFNATKEKIDSEVVREVFASCVRDGMNVVGNVKVFAETKLIDQLGCTAVQAKEAVETLWNKSAQVYAKEGFVLQASTEYIVFKGPGGGFMTRDEGMVEVARRSATKVKTT